MDLLRETIIPLRVILGVEGMVGIDLMNLLVVGVEEEGIGVMIGEVVGEEIDGVGEKG